VGCGCRSVAFHDDCIAPACSRFPVIPKNGRRRSGIAEAAGNGAVAAVAGVGESTSSDVGVDCGCRLAAFHDDCVSPAGSRFPAIAKNGWRRSGRTRAAGDGVVAAALVAGLSWFLGCCVASFAPRRDPVEIRAPAGSGGERAEAGSLKLATNSAWAKPVAAKLPSFLATAVAGAAGD